MKYSFLLNKKYYEWENQFITVEELKKLGTVSAEEQLFLKVQGQDQEINNKNPVDLSRFGIEQVYSVKGEKYQFIVNGQLFVSNEGFISAPEVRTVGKINPKDTLFLKVEGADREIQGNTTIDLKPYPIEEFYSKPAVVVYITVDNKEYEIKPGEYTVKQIKEIGHVKPAHDLDQVINNGLVTLEDNQVIKIKGGEQFKSRPKGGASS